MSSRLKGLWGILLFLCLTQVAIAVNSINVSLENEQLLLTPIHGGDGSAWGIDQCSSCHLINRIHSDAPVIQDIVKKVGYSTCAGCHGQNGTEMPRLCTVCHNEQWLPTAPIQQGRETHDFSVNESHPLNDGDCVLCHYSSDMDGQYEPSVDLSYVSNPLSSIDTPYSDGIEFCLRCHNTSHQIPGFDMRARFSRDPLVNIETEYSTVEKHGYVKGTRQGIYAGLREGSYQYGDVVECTDCHAMHGTHNQKLIIDRTDKGTTRLDPVIRELPVFINTANGDYSQLCVTCHAMDQVIDEGQRDAGNGLSGIHLVGTDCSQCHTHSITPQESIVVTPKHVSLAKGTLLLTPDHGWNRTAWGKEQCSACHLINTIHDNAPVIRNIVQRVGFSSCTGCHGQNGTDAPRLCTICHNPQLLPTAPIQQGDQAHDFDVNQSRVLNDNDCVACHYSSDMNAQYEPEIDLTYVSESLSSFNLPYKNSIEFCLRCHNDSHQQPGYEMEERFLRDPLVKMKTNYRFLDMHGYPLGSGRRTYSGLREGGYQYGDLVECTDCHAMHGTHNGKLIIDRTDTGTTQLDSSIRDLPVLINVDRGDYSQLCVTCHSMDTLVEQGNENTGNGLSGVHQVGTDCRLCHVHGLAAQTGL